eukprot:1985771-Prymnesium_polylepis.1
MAAAIEQPGAVRKRDCVIERTAVCVAHPMGSAGRSVSLFSFSRSERARATDDDSPADCRRGMLRLLRL